MEILSANNAGLGIIVFIFVATIFLIALYEIISYLYPKVEVALLECVTEKQSFPISISNFRDAIIIGSLITFGYVAMVFTLVIFFNRKLEKHSPAFIKEMLKIKLKIK